MIEKNIQRIQVANSVCVYDHIRSIFREAFNMGESGSYTNADEAWTRSLSSFDYDTSKAPGGPEQVDAFPEKSQQ